MNKFAVFVIILSFVIGVGVVKVQAAVQKNDDGLCAHKTTGKVLPDIYQGIDTVAVYIQSKHLAESILPINEFEEIIKEVIVNKYKNCNPNITISFIDDSDSALFANPENFGIHILMQRWTATQEIRFKLNQYRNHPVSFAEYIDDKNNLSYRGSIELHSEKSLNKKGIAYFLMQYLLYQVE